MGRLFRREVAPPLEQRMSFDEALAQFKYNGITYPLTMNPLMSPAPDVETSFLGYVHGVYQRSGVVAAAITARALLISELEFTWRRDRSSGANYGKPFGTGELGVLERPGGGRTRNSLLFQAEQDVSLAGNWYCHRDGDTLRRLRPDWVRIVIGSDMDPKDAVDQLDGEVIGYLYYPGGPSSGKPPTALLPEEVIHWAPEPDPVQHWRGQSWITSVLHEIRGDQQARDHKLRFFANGATPSLVFLLDKEATPDDAKEYRKLNEEATVGISNAYRNMYIGGGATVQVVGSKIGDIDYSKLQGADETRFAVRSRVPAVVLGIKEGLGGSALNSGNYGMARRLWSDGWFTPTAKSLCAAVERVLTVPQASYLSYDPGAVLFLQEDRKDEADILAQQAAAINTLVQAGYDADSAVSAIQTGDLSKLVGKHNGLPTVQQQPGTPDNTDNTNP